ncbi:uncharacterized protein LOC130015115 [Mercurialis annua]|uniref:uncharacterized protein LOC130015115 n=1 Tax=Mercurialis annua TaxID=3986 RepID=UPI0024AE372C|nr:uncharacterized protein LOC130015115 [Mercurialis annua]
MGKSSRIDSYFTRTSTTNLESDDILLSNVSDFEEPANKIARKSSSETDVSSLERDPGLRCPILEYPVAKRDEIRRAYIILGPYQPILPKYPLSGPTNRLRHFIASWYSKFPSWLEYSPSKDDAFCLPCYIFNKPNEHFGGNAFTIKGFQNWKKVNDGKNVLFYVILSQHIDNVLSKQSSVDVANNRLRLKTTIDAVRWLTFQTCSLRGNDESEESINSGNCREMVKLLASYNESVNKVVLENALKNAKYISPDVQKEILSIFAKKVRRTIREEIGEAKFCIIVDESRDLSKREQMAIVLRFVDKRGCVQERFFDLVHVFDTSAVTLKNNISAILSYHNLSTHNIRGQGYDGASNMRGEWNGASCKRQDELRAAQATNIAKLIETGEIETGTGKNQIGNLQRAGDTRWSSHISSICSLFDMFDATCTVLENVIKDENYSQRGDADSAMNYMTSFDFVFILHLMRDILLLSNDLCQALQRKAQDILNAFDLVSTTKRLIQNMREYGWGKFIKEVNLFCEKDEVLIPDMNAPFSIRQSRCRSKETDISIGHHYQYDLFTVTIDTQLQELNNTKDNYNLFNADNIYNLVEKYYPEDFTDQEKLHFKIQLYHYEFDVPQHEELKNLSTLSELCQGLMNTKKATIYPLVDRLIRLILTLPVTTATTERSFSAMSIVKTKLRNKMEDDYLADYLVAYIEKKISKTFTTDSIIDEFYDMKKRRVQFRD